MKITALNIEDAPARSALVSSHDFELVTDTYMESCARVSAIARRAASILTDRYEAERALRVAKYAEGRYLKRGMELSDASS